jgi:hypothetical protein
MLIAVPRLGLPPDWALPLGPALAASNDPLTFWTCGKVRSTSATVLRPLDRMSSRLTVIAWLPIGLTPEMFDPVTMISSEVPGGASGSSAADATTWSSCAAGSGAVVWAIAWPDIVSAMAIVARLARPQNSRENPLINPLPLKPILLAAGVPAVRDTDV